MSGIVLPFMVAAEIDLSEIQPFIGVKGGYQWADDSNYDHSDPNGIIVGVMGGIQFSRNWRWDVGYQYHEMLEAKAASIDVKTWLLESGLRYDWYVQDDLSVYGRLGVSYWDIDKSRPSASMLSATGWSPMGELGVSYDLRPNMRLSAGYQYIDAIGDSETGQYDSHALMVGLSYAFGSSSSEQGQDALGQDALRQDALRQRQLIEDSSVAVMQPQTFIFSAQSLGESYTFNTNSAEVSSQVFKDALTQLADILTTYPQSQVLIVGHTDSVGSDLSNQALSERRAQSVAAILERLGVKPSQMQVMGKGESSPIKSNDTKEGRAMNRRVKLTIPSFEYQQ
jgi:OOP family OmpA-OmpF porin